MTEQELAILKAQIYELVGDEKVWVDMHGNIAWDEAVNLNPQSTPQFLLLFKENTLLVTYSDDVKKIIGILIEIEPLDKTPLEDLGLNTCNHDIPFSFREVLSFDEPEPQPQPLPSCPSLDVASFHAKDISCYYHPCVDDPKKHYGFKLGLLGQTGSLSIDFMNLELVLKVVLLCLTKRIMCHGRLVFSGDVNREITVTETFHLQTDDELFDKELKQIEADDQAIQTILLSLPEDIYAAVNSCETAQEIWLRVQQMMKGSNIGIQEKKAKLFNEWERFTSNEGESIESYYHHFLKLMNDLKRNKHFPEKIASNLKFLNNLQPEWSRHVTIVHQTKDLHTADYTQLYDFLKYNQKERISSNPGNRQIAQPGMNMGQDRQMQMVGGNDGNHFRQYAGQNARNLAGYNDVIGNQVMQNAVQNLRVQNVGNQNGLLGVQWNGN
nr:hypothetical protein [Tanacetum cinerariifolium]